MVAVPQNHISRVLGYEQAFKNEVKATQNLPQKVTIFAPVSDLTINNKTPIDWNKRHTFINANEVYDRFGISPAFLSARILKPSSGGGGVNTPFDIYPIRETNATPTSLDFAISGDNRRNVTYSLIINGRKFSNGREIKFTIGANDTLRNKIDKIIQATNANIFSPVNASLHIITPSGKKIKTPSLTANLHNILAVEDGGLSIITNSNTYNVKVNFAGSEGYSETTDISGNLAAIYAVTSGSIGISEDSGVVRELVYANSGATSRVVTRSIPKNYGNLANSTGQISIKQGAITEIINIDTGNQAAVLTSALIDAPKLAAFKLLTNGKLKIQTNSMSQPVEVTLDFTTINNVADMVPIINTAFNVGSVDIVVSKNAHKDFLEFRSINKGANVTIHSLAATIGTDLNGATYFDFSNSYYTNGLDAINLSSNKSTTDWLVDAIDKQLKINKVTKFAVKATYDSKNLSIYSTDLASTEELVIAVLSGNIMDPNKLDLVSAFKHRTEGTIDSANKLLALLQVNMIELELGEVKYNVTNNKFTFYSSTKGSSSSLHLSAGTTGTDLSTAALFNVPAATTVPGKATRTDLQGVFEELKLELALVTTDIDITLEDDKLVFENKLDVGETSILGLNNLANHTGEQLVSSTLFDVANSVNVSGNNEVDAVKFTTRWSGVSSRGLKIRFEPDQKLENNLVFTQKNEQPGTGVLNLTEAFANVGDVWTTLLVNVYGEDYFDIFQDFIGNPEAKSGRFKYDVFKPAVVLTGSTESEYDKLVALGANRSLDLANSVCTAPNAEVFPFEVAAAYAELCSRIYEETPHLTTNGQVLEDIPLPDFIGVMNDSDYREQLILNGISTVSANSSTGRYTMENHVTFRRPVDQPQTAVDYRFVRNMIGIDYNVAYRVLSRMRIYVFDKAIVSGKVKARVQGTIKAQDVKGILFSLFDECQEDGLFYDSSRAVDTLSVTIDTVNPERFNISYQYDRSSILSIVSTTGTASFKLGN